MSQQSLVIFVLIIAYELIQTKLKLDMADHAWRNLDHANLYETK